ncbi:TetR/AcrR family transcriptional regulator [Actinosynnema pretiosum subsp. pretiosum]|uniref:TetR/AcrR family transcriptional regulator n=1 Tax=Actinosynnema pretiosum subsp. pretiosum TaxID=103721 RepID=A0AA45R506_9PSEU|nr:TetR-family transcriptional regulator [Actinosynnema pretiosum subsp. pretiosum]QUF05461.1 TetR/AcrR family transcriptional regulator [Actinosynnema pretiosum subsp. pretiosum]
MVQSHPRRRSAAAHRAILEAVRDLLLESGYERLSMDGIAARAGVGKQTLYRWWPSKAAVVAEATVAGLVWNGGGEVPETGDVAVDLRAWLTVLVESTAERASLVRALISASADDRGEARRLYLRFTGPHRDAVLARLRRGVDSGQVRPDADLDAVADACVGTLLFQVLTDNENHSASRLDGLLRLLLPGLLVHPRTTGASEPPGDHH